MGSVTVAAWIARLAFPGLLAIGWLQGELGIRALFVFVVLGCASWFGLPRWVPTGELLVTSALACLDIALVLVIFKGDVRIT